ncbi:MULTISPECIES: substrate-binding periplasmic protein [unclassified Halomonas]|uniref:substrate-binding periplasmic protein n=1 Tax=unclassified Halomonas TaxID=2609666 RepID=UPI0006DA4B71|nr:MULTISPECIES: ABC transporter substrate-binding protein [unclassified Halomonas]KPQ20453.1 MAG: ABC-type polar amino acid uptake system substrate-binding component [Halomonas sp. HL-93]SBR46308.1 amino acid ABC transporter substrate-binding protein, PAAT family [Halomonas sp. HL-93]SNY98692.1 amino acid ABC transporter substrate-binding protein, PAAT family [Halomonas sp. hl-4]
MQRAGVLSCLRKSVKGQWLVGLLCFFAPLALANGAPAALTSLTFVTEEYPPYNYLDEQTGQLKGRAVTLLETMFEHAGSPFKRRDILYYPWVRGYELAQSEPNTVLFSTTRTPSRESHFNWIGPIARDRVVLLAWQDEVARLTSLDDAIRQQLSVAIIREDIGAHALSEAGYPAELLRPAIDNRSALHMLQRGRVDLWAYSAEVARWIASQEGLDAKQLNAVHTLSESDLYFAINPATDQALVDRLQQAFDAVRAGPTDREVTHHGD